MIAEAYYYDKKVKGHMDLVTLVKHIGLIRPKRLILTHMSSNMLDRIQDISFEAAEDGKIIEI